MDNVDALSDVVSSVGGMKYWINTVSRNHVLRGVAGGFTQANHGKPHMLRRLSRDDWIVFYSPKTDYPKGDVLQTFTGIGRIDDDAPFQAADAPDGHWRRTVAFLPCIETPVRPMIEQLEFIIDKKQWGYKFRFGMFEINEHDFGLLRTALTHTVAA